jgi:hypothetical protein
MRGSLSRCARLTAQFIVRLIARGTASWVRPGLKML